MKMTIADHLKILMGDLLGAASYAVVAKKIGISTMYLWEIIHSKKLPSFKILRRICDALAEDSDHKYAFLSCVLLRDKQAAVTEKLNTELHKYMGGV